MPPLRRAVLLTTAAASLYTFGVSAQVIVSPEPGNALTVSASVSVTPSNGLYTYSYSFRNATASAQSVWFVVVELSGDAAAHISNIVAPKGWQAITNGPTPGIGWAATEVPAVPADFVDDGSILPSPFQIGPGQTLTGFSFQSPTPPIAVRFFAQGFTPLPRAVDAGDIDAAGMPMPDYTNDSIIGVTQGPAPTAPSTQPSGRGLFTFVGVTNNAVLHGGASTLSESVKFSSSTTLTDRNTFRAYLNGRDVTALFVADTQGGVTGILGSPAAPLKAGANVLRGAMASDADGAGAPLYDAGLVVFYVNAVRPGDLNGDGAINCADMAIIRAGFGKKAAVPGFDPRADVNGDGVVNILDLSAEAKLLPAGTRCN